LVSEQIRLANPGGSGVLNRFSRPVLARLIREHEIPRPANPVTRAKYDHRAYLRRN
jgi:hypothetical protein